MMNPESMSRRAAHLPRWATRYVNDVLGTVTVQREGAATVCDMGEWKGEVGSRRNPDGTTSFLTIAPGILFGLEFVVGSGL
jgi:hypothetical protein